MEKKKEFVVIQISKEDFSLDRRTLFMFVERDFFLLYYKAIISHICAEETKLFSILKKINCDVFL